MCRLSLIDRAGISSKLVFMLLIVVATFAGILAIVGGAFLNVRQLASEEAVLQLDLVSKNSRTSRDLAGISSEIELLSHTFYGRDDLVDAYGRSLIGTIEGLKARSADSRIRRKIDDLEKSLNFFVGQCSRINLLLAARSAVDKESHAEIDKVENLLSRRMIEYTKRGAETYYFDELFSLVTGFRESLLLIGNSHNGHRGTDYRSIISRIDDLLLRLKTLTVTAPDIGSHVGKLMQSLGRYRSLTVDLEGEMTGLAKRSEELKAVRNDVLAILEENDRSIMKDSAHMTSKIGEIIRSAEVYVIVMSVAVLCGTSLLIYSIIHSSIRRPLKEILDDIDAIREGRFVPDRHGPRGDEWGVIRESLTTMNKELAKAIEAHRRSEAFLDSVIENIPDMIFIKDAKELRFVRFNRAGEDLLGYSRQDLLGKNDHDFFPKQEADFFTAKDREVLNQGGVLDIPEEPIQTRFLGRRILHTRKIPLYDVDGSPEYMLGISEDITDRKKALLALEQEGEKNLALLRNASDGIHILDSDGYIIEASDSFCRMLGYSRDEIIGMQLTQWDAGFVGPELIEKFKAQFKQPVRSQFETRHRRKDGTIFDVEISGFPLELGGRMVVFNSSRDITERKKAEDALLESESRYRHLVESTNDWIWEIDPQGVYTYASPHCLEILGYAPEEILGKTPFDLMASDEAQRLRGVLASIVAAAEPFRGLENVNLHKDGRQVVLETNGVPILDVEGKLLGYRGMDRDITERKKAEGEIREKTAQLEELTRHLEQRVHEEVALRSKSEQTLVQQSKLAAMGEMLGAIAHQWRQPLNALGLIVQNLQDAHAYGELNQAYLERMVAASMLQIQHMSTTIDDFRNFFLPDKERTAFDAMQAVGDVLTLFSAQLAASNIDFRLICHTHGKTFSLVEEIAPCPEKMIRGFRNEFEHVIMNLLNNAREAIVERRDRRGLAPEERGLISFEFRKSDRGVRIEVADNGGGIPAEALGRVFEPYFTTKDPAKGTGLGLYMSKMIIEEHMEGTLGVRNVDGGALFTIELPIGEGGEGHERTAA